MIQGGVEIKFVNFKFKINKMNKNKIEKTTNGRMLRQKFYFCCDWLRHTSTVYDNVQVQILDWKPNILYIHSLYL